MADADNSSEWILLREARDLLAGLYQSRALAQQLLRENLEVGKVGWRCALLKGRKSPSDPGISDRAFWNERSGNLIVLRVDWDESSARRNGMYGYSAFRIEVPRADVEAMLPGGVGRNEPSKPLDPGEWVKDELKRMKASGKLRGLSIRRAASTLESPMAKAFERGEVTCALKSGAIRNRISQHKLWPKPD